jgi:MFS family permease
MISLLKATWALMLGVVLMMAGNGLQASLLGLKGSLAGFSSEVMGVVMSGYYAGFFLSVLTTPKAIRQVGHIRVFAALAALASIAALAAPIFVRPEVWFLLRAVTGFCYSGLYVIAESWINDRADNDTRGRLLSVYMLVQYSGLTGGQAMLNLASPAGFELFSLVAILISLAVVPILMAVRQAPRFEEPRKTGILALYRISPLAVVGVLFTGFAQSNFFSLGAVYGDRIGLDTRDVSIFMIVAVLGGFCLQWPIGRTSDRFDRRLVLTVVAFASAGFGLLAIPASGYSYYALLAATLIYSGSSLPIYSLSVAHTNDYLKPDQMVSASSTMVLVYGCGAIGGPALGGLLMGRFGSYGFWGYLAAVHLILGCFALYRMTRRPSRPVEEQGRFVALPENASPVAAALAPVPPAAAPENRPDV